MQNGSRPLAISSFFMQIGLVKKSHTYKPNLEMVGTCEMMTNSVGQSQAPESAKRLESADL